MSEAIPIAFDVEREAFVFLTHDGYRFALPILLCSPISTTRAAWLDHLHRDLDAAVAAAYGWEWPLTGDDTPKRLFELNQIRTAKA